MTCEAHNPQQQVLPKTEFPSFSALVAQWTLATTLGHFIATSALAFMFSLGIKGKDFALHLQVAIIFSIYSALFVSGQSIVLRARTHSFVWWIVASGLSGLFFGYLSSSIAKNMSWFLIVLLLEGAIRGLAQCFVLHQSVKRTAWWLVIAIVPHGLANVVAIWLWTVVAGNVMQEIWPIPPILLWAKRAWDSIFYGLIAGTMQGSVLWLLFRYQRRARSS